ncbi:MAG: PAS domain-containing protein [Candidatus Bipolaricaulota bacterium]|nr:PAS domain-containing protein [Candidatus Bipolaricaulota bacterium]MBS3791840.1 PAS domain-containing protein [Candidatus Bipolaricaulota bacterium]
METKNIKARVDGIAVLDSQRRFEYLDQSFASLYGYQASSDLIGKPWAETFALPQVERFEEELLPAMEDQQKWTGVISGLKRDGVKLAQQISVFQLQKDKLVFLVKNIAPKGRSVFKVGRPEYNWPEAIESTPDIVAIISPDYEIEKINSTGAKKLGMTASEIEGEKCYEVVHRLASPIQGCPCKQAIEACEAGIGEVAEDGTNYVVTAFPLVDETEELTAFLHTVTGAGKNIPSELKACEFFIRELAKLKDKDDIYPFLLHSIREVLEPAKITLYEQNPEGLECSLQRGYRRKMVGEKLYRSGTGARVEALKNDRSIYIPDVETSENFIRYDPEVKCEFVAPISSSERRFGVLDIRKLESDSITPSERNLIEIMASEVGKVLEDLSRSQSD